MINVEFNRFYRYDELTNIIQSLERDYPDLMRVESIGKSYEGRDIWLLILTNFETGPDQEKPALWVDGNIHASEISPSSTCLYLVTRLLAEYKSNPSITQVMDSRVFYICPRVNPDGAEWALADKPKIIRSSTRPYPYDEEPYDGLVREDVDGDGRMLIMRIPDVNGPWKISDKEPRLMTLRQPGEYGGQYYRLLPEGRLENYDGVTIKIRPNKEGLDLNRNFPSEWRLEYQQPGAGPYPTSEPEARALVQFITSHKNITAGITFHTYSGVLLRPSSTHSDDEMPAEDLWTYKTIGKKGTEITGYPNISVYHDFRYHPKEIITGGFDDWLFDHLGVFAWTVEIWSPQRQAGISEYKFIDWYREHPFEDDLKLLKWSDEVLDGKGYINWYPYEHPQLGKIELGGWNVQYAFRNPPPEFLEKEIALFPDWVIWHLLISPKLELLEASAESLGEGVHRIRFVVHNTGWLPTYVTKKALERKAVRGVVCEIELPEGAELRVGKPREERDQLEGRAYKNAITVWDFDGTTDRIKVEWVVRMKERGKIKLTAWHERAGTVHAELKLP